MIIRVTTDNRTTIHPYPSGSFREKQSFLTGLIGNGCDLVEHVRPTRLYTHWAVSTDIESGKMACILVDVAMDLMIRIEKFLEKKKAAAKDEPVSK